MIIYIYIFFILTLIGFTTILCFRKNNELYERPVETVPGNPDLIISTLGYENGFFSQFFFTINHYIYAKKHNKNFKLDTTKWLFKYKDGWTDYFKDIKLSYTNITKEPIKFGHSNNIYGASIKEYESAIKDIYIYNEKTEEAILNAKKKLNLLNRKYNSIFIRRGDKLANESDLIAGSMYINVLSAKDKECKIVYLQTDDYGCYLELQEYNKTNNLNLEIITLCEPTSRGSINNMHNKNLLVNMEGHRHGNRDHIKNNIDFIKDSKTLTEMTPQEMYKHTLDMLIGIDILANSNMCVLDYQSNVSRFIKLFHKNPKNVFDIENPNSEWDYNMIHNLADYTNFYR